MKNKLMLFVVLMTLSFTTFSQSVTGDNVTVPRKWLSGAAIDLIQYDKCKEENLLLKKANINLESLYENEKDANILQQNRNKQLEDKLIDCNVQRDVLINNNKAINAQLTTSVNKERIKGQWKTIGGILSGIGIGIITGIIISQ